MEYINKKKTHNNFKQRLLIKFKIFVMLLISTSFIMVPQNERTSSFGW